MDGYIPAVVEAKNHNFKQRVSRTIPSEIEHLIDSFTVTFV